MRQMVPPFNGEICGVSPKTCFFGNKDCPSVGASPETQCFCDGVSGDQVWTCEDEPCPAITAPVTASPATAAPATDAIASNTPTTEITESAQIFSLSTSAASMCVDLEGGATAAGTNVGQWFCHGLGNQEWQQIPLASGGFQLRNPRSDKCMDVAGSSQANGANVLLWFCAATPNQSLSWDRGRLKFLHSGKCLDVVRGSPNAGANLVQWTCTENSNQQFTINPKTT